MGEVNFYLKKKEPSTGKSLIYLQYKYAGDKFVYSFGQTINPKNWNKSKQRVKSNNLTTADGEHSLNELINNLEDILLETYRKELANGIPPKSKLKKALDDFINQNKVDPNKLTLYKLIDRFISGEIKHKGKDKKPSTLTKYSTTLNHLKDFEAKKKYKVDFDTITLDFFYKYVTFLREKGLAQNTIAKNIDVLKSFMKKAVRLHYTNNVEFESEEFNVEWEDTDSIYLTETEISSLFKYDLSGNKKLEQTRDLFVFGCHVGLRFGDYSDVKPEHIITIDGEKFIRMKTKKTGEIVIIPCNPVVLQIFGKYADNPNSLPKSISNQKFNDYIKDACKEAKLKEKGRLIDKPEKELWECVSSHTCRRSFSTNLYLDGYPTFEIMKITGHRSESAFLKYIKVSKLDAAKRLSTYMKKKWEQKLSKIV